MILSLVKRLDVDNVEYGQLSTIPDELLQWVALQTGVVILLTLWKDTGRASHGMHRGETGDSGQ